MFRFQTLGSTVGGIMMFIPSQNVSSADNYSIRPVSCTTELPMDARSRTRVEIKSPDGVNSIVVSLDDFESIEETAAVQSDPDIMAQINAAGATTPWSTIKAELGL